MNLSRACCQRITIQMITIQIISLAHSHFLLHFTVLLLVMNCNCNSSRSLGVPQYRMSQTDCTLIIMRIRHTHARLICPSMNTKSLNGKIYFIVSPETRCCHQCCRRRTTCECCRFPSGSISLHYGSRFQLSLEISTSGVFLSVKQTHRVSN